MPQRFYFQVRNDSWKEKQKSQWRWKEERDHLQSPPLAAGSGPVHPPALWSPPSEEEALSSQPHSPSPSVTAVFQAGQMHLNEF